VKYTLVDADGARFGPHQPLGDINAGAGDFVESATQAGGYGPEQPLAGRESWIEVIAVRASDDEGASTLLSATPDDSELAFAPAEPNALSTELMFDTFDTFEGDVSASDEWEPPDV
jgi:hypothetical protein